MREGLEEKAREFDDRREVKRHVRVTPERRPSGDASRLGQRVDTPKLKIPIKSSAISEHNVKPMRIRALRKVVCRPLLVAAPRLPASSKSVPHLKAVRPQLVNVRVPITEPIELEVLETTKLELRLRSPPDISVRPVASRKVRIILELAELPITHARVPSFRPLIIPSRSERIGAPCIPRLRLVSSPKAEPRKAESTSIAITDQTEKMELDTRVEGFGTGGAGTGEIIQDPMETLFRDVDGRRIVKSAVRDLEPLVVLFRDAHNESYIQTFETLLLRLYRERYGGYPEVKKLSLREDWNKGEIERWLDEGKLFLIDLDSDLDSRRARIDEKLLADRLWAIFSRRRGIAIFYTRSEETFREYEKILEGIVLRFLNLRAKVIKIAPRRLSYEEKLELVNLLFGFVDVQRGLPGDIDSMDILLNLSSEKYEEKLRTIEHEYCDVFGLVKPGENESEEHLRGKAFILKCLVRKLERDGKIKRGDLRAIKETIETEKLIGGLVVDVCCGNENYEFETLFREGFKGIHDKLRRYEENNVSNVRIVVEPITAFLHAKEFADVLKRIKEIYPTINVDFFTFDISSERLVPLKDYLRAVERFVAKHLSASP